MKIIRIILSNIFIINFYLYNCEKCGLDPPRDEKDCYDNDIDDYDCCFLYKEGYSSLCVKIKDEVNLNPSLVYTYENVEYQKICGKKTFAGQIGTKCGIDNPQNFTDCDRYSKKNNFCCFYNTKDVKKCFWLGENFSSEIYTFKQTEDYSVNCHSEYLNFLSILNILFIVILL